jgi:hypothetical protein
MSAKFVFASEAMFVLVAHLAEQLRMLRSHVRCLANRLFALSARFLRFERAILAVLA